MTSSNPAGSARGLGASATHGPCVLAVPALRRFEEASAVTKATEPQEGRPPRLVYTLTSVGRELLHDMLADLPAEQAADPSEFLARLGQFAEINSAERAAVLASRARAVGEQLAHYRAMLDLAVAHGERWGALATGELIRRREQELAWLAELGELASATRAGGAARPRARPDRRSRPRAS